MLDTQQRRDEAVATGLCHHAVTGIDHNNGEVTVGGTRGHVASVLLMPRGVGDDEFAFVGGEVAIGNIDGDALLAFTLQTINQQRQIKFTIGGVEFLGIVFNG